MRNAEYVRFKMLNPLAKLPAYSTPGAACMDLYAVESVCIPAGAVAAVGLGFAMQLPEGFEAQIRPRSGLALKSTITVMNTPGCVDEDYRGEVKVILINHGSEVFWVNAGDRIAQMSIAPVYPVLPLQVDRLDDTERGEGGFGSTGR